MTIEIKNRFTNEVIKTIKAETLVRADLSGADLSGADLSRAKYDSFTQNMDALTKQQKESMIKI